VGATKRQLEDLKTHPAWMEMKQLLLDRLMIIRNELEASNMSEVDTAIRRGECKNIRFVTELPDMIIRDFEEGKGEEQWQEKVDRVE